MKRLFLVATAIFVSAMPVTPKPSEGGSILAEPKLGQSYRINFTDIDGHARSTAEGRFNVVVLMSKANNDKARSVGDRIPDFCLGNADYRMITVVVFQTDHSRPVRAVLRTAIRRRLNSEAQRLQKRYEQHKIARDARHDVFAVADFDGTIAKQLDSEPSAELFRVFVFAKNGELRRQWDDVPSAEDLAATLK